MAACAAPSTLASTDARSVGGGRGDPIGLAPMVNEVEGKGCGRSSQRLLPLGQAQWAAGRGAGAVGLLNVGLHRHEAGGRRGDPAGLVPVVKEAGGRGAARGAY